MNFITDNISIRGYSHILDNKECQDSSISWSTKKYGAAIVCDGHGGEKYFRSAIGSKFACQIGKEAIEVFMDSIERLDKFNIDDKLENLERYIIQSWRTAVDEHLQNNPFEDDEKYQSLSDESKKGLESSPIKAYGSTFIAAVMAINFYFILKLGDGNANIIYFDDTIEFPKDLEDDQLQFNQTTSLCQSNAIAEFKHTFFRNINKKAFKGIILTTDGIINCFNSVKSYHSLIKNIYEGFSNITDPDVYMKEKEDLESSLHELSQRGSGDDLSVGIITYK